MIALPFRRASQAGSIDALYGMIVAQARLPEFYRDYGVPDTVDGRLDMIVLHMVLLLRRLTELNGGTLPPLGQRLFDHFCQDMDDNFREMGVGDFGVPKRMQRVGEAFYGRSKAYESALIDLGPAILETVVARNVFGQSAADLGARRLAAYMREAAKQLEQSNAEELAAAKIKFPDPASIAAPAADGTKLK